MQRLVPSQPNYKKNQYHPMQHDINHEKGLSTYMPGYVKKKIDLTTKSKSNALGLTNNSSSNITNR